MGEKTFPLAKQQKHLQSTPLAEPVRTAYVLAMYAHFLAMFGWSKKKRLSSRRAVEREHHSGDWAKLLGIFERTAPFIFVD